jgi:hypothetical protein
MQPTRPMTATHGARTANAFMGITTPQPSGFASSLRIYDLATIVSMYSSRMMQITLIRLHFQHLNRRATHPSEYKQVTLEH